MEAQIEMNDTKQGEINSVNIDCRDLRKQLKKGEVLEWLFTDSRQRNQELINKNCGEWQPCANGHTNFVSSYHPFSIGKKQIFHCRECGIEIFRFSPFAVSRRELNT